MLGVGLAAALAAITLALALTGRLGLYINPDSSWFAVSMAVVALGGTVLSFALPLGSEADHGHDHDLGHGHGHGDGAAEERVQRAVRSAHPVARPRPGGARRVTATAGTIATATGGVLAAGVVAAILATPPATLSAELAMTRDTGSAPLFQGADNVALAATGDTASFGVGEWASVFATATNPEAFDGDEVALTGFVTPGGDGFALTRLVITHCVIDAQPASIPIAITGSDDAPETGTWVSVAGTIRDVDGQLQVQAADVRIIDEPHDPYEY